MSFTPTADHRWLWTNSASITEIDKVFRQGPLYKAALQTKPFSEFKIH